MPPFRYETRDNPYAGTIGDLILRAGDPQARVALRSGEIAAKQGALRGATLETVLRGVGQLPQRVVAFQQEQADQQQARGLRAAQQRAYDASTAETVAQTETRGLDNRARARSLEADARFDGLVQSGKSPMEAAFLAYPPERAAVIAPAFKAFDEVRRGQAKDARQAAGQMIEGFVALSPEKQAEFWPFLRGSVIAGGFGDEATMPEAPTPDLIAGIRGWATEPDKPFAVGGSVAVPAGATAPTFVTPPPVTPPAPPRQPAPTEASLAVAAANGDEAAARALALLRAQRAPTARPRVSGTAPAPTGTKLPSAYATAIGRATLNMPATRRGPLMETVERLWSEGDEAGLKDVIRQTVVDTEPVDVRNQVLGRMATTASLADAATILEEMERKGVPTGFFRGTAEDLVRKLGATTNPEYVALGNRLMGTLINYRRAATGVAFGEREGADYARMFPNYKNQLPVNRALITGLLREMRTYDRTYWEHKVGKDGAALIGVLEPARPSAPTRRPPGALPAGGAPGSTPAPASGPRDPLNLGL